MTAKTGIKVIIDIFMTVLFLVLMEPKVTDLSFHERGGIAICLIFIIHLLLNGKWIKTVTGSLFTKRVSAVNKLNWVVDFMLLTGFSLILISGMGIAKTIDFSGLIPETSLWRGMHSAASFTILLAVGIHAGLHISWISCQFRKLKNLMPGLRKKESVNG